MMRWLYSGLFIVIMMSGVGLFTSVIGQEGESEIWVCPQGCQFQSIQAAIDAAPEGATIFIGTPGIYYENLTISKSLKLVGQWLPIILDKEYYNAPPTITVEGYRPIEVTLQSLFLQRTSTVAIAVNGQARLTVDFVTIYGSTTGLLAYGQAQVVIRRSHLQNGSVIAAGAAQVVIEDSSVFGDMVNALWGADTAQLIVRNSSIYDNDIGVSVDDSAKVIIEGSQIYKNRVGIAINGSGTVEMAHSTSAYNEFIGIWLIDEANLNMRESVVHHNAGWGIAAWLRKCGFQNDEYHGTAMIDNTNVIIKNGEGDICLP